MNPPKLPQYLLQEQPDITEVINCPLKSTQRIKYTSFDVSKTLIAFGATSGGIYVFSRQPCEFSQLIPNKDGAITRLSISSDERHIAFANGKGTVTVAACDPTLTAGHKIASSKEHRGNEVTALVWSDTNTVFSGDDIGRISVLVLPNFRAQTIFQSGAQTIMNLDSRICQLDVKDFMLLVSTLTRSYICDTSQEQYRQIGQKLRDGEYGACFIAKEKPVQNGTANEEPHNLAELKKYNIVVGDLAFAVNEKLGNTLIYCARPSSRLWEASVDGTVQKTHLYKQVLAKQPSNIISYESYENENVIIKPLEGEADGQSCNFPKLFSVRGSAIFTFKKDSLYFLDINNVDHTMWFSTNKDIVDCKVYSDMIYVWLQDGSLSCLRFMRIDKYLLKCYLDEKYVLCALLCALYSDYLLSSSHLSTKLRVLMGLKDKVSNLELLNRIMNVLDKFDSLKDDGIQKSGIFIIDNTYQQQALLNDEEESMQNNEHTFSTLKDLSTSMTDKINTSKKILKEKWEDFEDKIKHLGEDTTPSLEIEVPKRTYDESHDNIPELAVYDNEEIVYKENINNLEEQYTLSDSDRICKCLYQKYILNAIGEQTDVSNIISVIQNYSCDIKEIHELMLTLEEYCIKIGALDESKLVPNNIFLSYIDNSENTDELLDEIINNEVLYKYFVDSCITVNKKSSDISNTSCECGYPLPFANSNKTPIYSRIIDKFIEKQWSNQTKEQCYAMCRRMPYLWRKILHLRRNEDLTSLLMILLQILDEDLLHSFLPQFTLETWERVMQLYAVLQSNLCLNCNKKFEHICVKKSLSWDDIGALIITSVGGSKAVKIMERNSDLIGTGELSTKFYHACLLETVFGKVDGTIRARVVDTVYDCYESEEARQEICKILRGVTDGTVKNSSLPIVMAANSRHWGLENILEFYTNSREHSQEPEKPSITITMKDIVEFLSNSTGNTDCPLCGLPCNNEILIQDGGLFVFKCGHMFHGACLELNKIKLCPSCSGL